MLQVEAGNDESGGAAQTYGVLSTRLDEALTAAERALGPHVGLLPDGRLDRLQTLRAELAARRIRIAIYGEVKAGKSTLINAIAGAVLSPDAFEPLTATPVRITYGPRTVWHIEDYVVDNVAELERIMRDGTPELREVQVETSLDLLKLGGQVDLLDTPGVGSEDRFDVISGEVLRSLDAVILVVRYPGLFTQFTRRLVESLEKDIGKLFVVWNLDAACYELSYDDRMRHAETLRANVSGAHELYQVDARAALRGALAGDATAREVSGLGAFTSSLARFASSEKREVVALREAAKGSNDLLSEAQRLLGQRQAELQAALDQARGQIAAVQQVAEKERTAVRGQFAAAQAAAARIGEERARAASESGARLIKQLRSARGRWTRRGDAEQLHGAVSQAVHAYADEVESAARAAVSELRAAAKAAGADVNLTPRSRTVPAISPVAPEERLERASQGHGRWLRRTLWRGWYLPGLAAFERAGLADDLAAQSAWYDTAARATEAAAKSVLDARLEGIDRRAEKDAGQIKKETSYAANEAEHGALGQHVPVISAQLASVVAINTEARTML